MTKKKEDFTEALKGFDMRQHAPCGCHFIGEKIVMPKTAHGFEKWFKRWNLHRVHCTVPDYMFHHPDNDLQATRASALNAFWMFIHKRGSAAFDLMMAKALKKMEKEQREGGIK